MGRKGGKKYRREIRKEQSERDKDARFWKLGKQLSDPLGEYRRFIANLRNKEINEVDDFIDIPINLVDLTANLITSLITGENCLYESINESDKRMDHTLNKIKEEEKQSEVEEEEEKSSSKQLLKRKKSRSKELDNNMNTNEITFTKIQPNSSSSSIKNNKSYSFNFEEYCQHENEESFHFIRKIIKKTQLSLTTFIVGLFFIYSYKHMEKDKRNHIEHKASKYLFDWPIPTPKKTNKKKKRRRKSKNKNNNNNNKSEEGSNSHLSVEKNHPSTESIDHKVQVPKNKIESLNKSYTSEYNTVSSVTSSDTDHYQNNIHINTETQKSRKENDQSMSSPILKSEFLSSFQPRNITSSNISNSSSITSALCSSKSSQDQNLNLAMAQYPSPSHSDHDEDEKESSEINEKEPLIDDKRKKSKEELYNVNDSEKNEEEDDDDDEEEEEEEDDYEKRISFQQRMHRRQNSRFNSLMKNENFSKNFDYLSSCYILSDRYGSYVIPTFLASIIVADKLLYDATYTNSSWSEFTEGRYTLEDINELERRFLYIMNFQLFISQKKFDEFLSYLDFILCLQKIRAWGSIPFSLSYSDIYTLTKKIDSKYFDAYPQKKNNIYDNLKLVFKIILGFLIAYIILLFIYLFWKNHGQ